MDTPVSKQGVLHKLYDHDEEKAPPAEDQKQAKLTSIFDSPRVSFAQPISDPTRRKLAYPQWDQADAQRDNDSDDHETIVTNNTTPDRAAGRPDFDCFPPGAAIPATSAAAAFSSPARAMVGAIRGGPMLMSPVTQKSPDGGDGKGTKPRMWTLEEDRILLSAVRSARQPMKWPAVARAIPDRTGKQCRERYLNHLKPKLKVEGWSPVEDALVFHLFYSSGSKWARMTKLLPGRTDNGIKNRFHHLRRRLEKDLLRSEQNKGTRDTSKDIRKERLRKLPAGKNNEGSDLLPKVHGLLGYLASEAVQGSGPPNHQYSYGPFRKADAEGEQCNRCHFFLPSVQSGTQLCTVTGWCIMCTRIPPYVSGDMLRECLNLIRSRNAKWSKVIESWGEGKTELLPPKSPERTEIVPV